MEAAQSTSEPTPAWQDAGSAPQDAQDPGALKEHPEILVGAAFAGGLALAGLLRWLDR